MRYALFLLGFPFYAMRLLGQQEAILPTHVVVNPIQQKIRFLQKSEDPELYHELIISYDTRLLDSVKFERPGGRYSVLYKAKGDTILLMGQAFGYKPGKLPFAKALIFSDYRTTYQVSSKDTVFVTIKDVTTGEQRFALSKRLKLGGFGRVPVILESGFPEFFMAKFNNQKILLAYDDRNGGLRGLSSQTHKPLYIEVLRLGKWTETRERLTLDTVTIFYKGATKLVATYTYDHAQSADHFYIFRKNNAFYPFIYACPMHDTLTTYRAYFLESKESEWLQLLAGNRMVWVDRFGQKYAEKPVPTHEVHDVYAALQMTSPGRFISKTVTDTKGRHLMILAMKDSLTMDLDVRRFCSMHDEVAKLSVGQYVIGFDQDSLAYRYLVQKKESEFVFMRIDPASYHYTRKVSDTEPYQFTHNGLIGFFPGTLVAKYAQLEPFDGGFARYVKPDKTKGWVSLDGVEFPDLKN